MAKYVVQAWAYVTKLRSVINQSINQFLFVQLTTETHVQNKADTYGQDSETESNDHCPKSKNK